MKDSVSRREFLGTASGITAGAFVASSLPTKGSAPAVITRKAPDNVAVASGNGLRAVERAGQLMAQGVDTLDAAIEGVKIQELDPEDTSVGYGGLPNEDGVVQLDASCMHGPTRRACAVLLYTNHIFLVGEGAKQFALSYGFKEEDLMTERSREAWLKWRANRGANDDWINIEQNAQLIPRPTGTINCNVVNSNGDVSSVTTTSGLAWKIPGRVGDSSLVGAGQYTDNEIGAAGSTGLGEANIKVCGAFLTVESMRRGLKPADAALETLRRVVATTEPRLLDEQGRPRFGLSFYAVNKNGEFGAASMYANARYAAFDGETAELYDAAYLYERDE
ncbi:MAG: N(4)-(beta-N-acetylglucosaminyl)-L-asparaginase [Gemmatimonadales bacterium]